MRHLIVGTAGHIDHGKTTLVKALTGTDTDRLKEEKERGISIELGFAFLTLPDGTRVGIVDVPGHERFVKTMLAGVGPVSASCPMPWVVPHTRMQSAASSVRLYSSSVARPMNTHPLSRTAITSLPQGFLFSNDLLTRCLLGC